MRDRIASLSTVTGSKLELATARKPASSMRSQPVPLLRPPPPVEARKPLVEVALVAPSVGEPIPLLPGVTVAVVDHLEESTQPHQSRVSGVNLLSSLLDNDQMVAMLEPGLPALPALVGQHTPPAAPDDADVFSDTFDTPPVSNMVPLMHPSTAGARFVPDPDARRLSRISGVFDVDPVRPRSSGRPPSGGRPRSSRGPRTSGFDVPPRRSHALDLPSMEARPSFGDNGVWPPQLAGGRPSSAGSRPRRSRSTEPAPRRKSMAVAPLVLAPIPMWGGHHVSTPADTISEERQADAGAPPCLTPALHVSMDDAHVPDRALMGTSFSSRPMTAPMQSMNVSMTPSTRVDTMLALMARGTEDDEANLLEGVRQWKGPAVPPPAPSAASWMTPQQNSMNTCITDMRQYVSSPGPPGAVNCHVKRDKLRGLLGAGAAFSMYMEGPNVEHIPGNPLDARLLLYARRSRGGIAGNGSCYKITIEPYADSPAASQVIGTLSSNFLGTEFVGTDANGAHICAVTYGVNLLGIAGPRKMVACAALPGAHLPDGVVLRAARSEKRLPGTALLTGKSPRWNAQLQSYVLNFHGRVSAASVKNFQLCTERDARMPRPTVQFGKVVQTDTFTLDFCHPISALQAFMLALASCDNKLACE